MMRQREIVFGDGWSRSPGGLYVPYKPEPKPVGVDLFAGAGGFSLGLLARGAMNSILIGFADGLQVVTSRYAVRRRQEHPMAERGPDATS